MGVSNENTPHRPVAQFRKPQLVTRGSGLTQRCVQFSKSLGIHIVSFLVLERESAGKSPETIQLKMKQPRLESGKIIS